MNKTRDWGCLFHINKRNALYIISTQTEWAKTKKPWSCSGKIIKNIKNPDNFMAQFVLEQIFRHRLARLNLSLG